VSSRLPPSPTCDEAAGVGLGCQTRRVGGAAGQFACASAQQVWSFQWCWALLYRQRCSVGVWVGVRWAHVVMPLRFVRFVNSVHAVSPAGTAAARSNQTVLVALLQLSAALSAWQRPFRVVCRTFKPTICFVCAAWLVCVSGRWAIRKSPISKKRSAVVTVCYKSRCLTLGALALPAFTCRIERGFPALQSSCRRLRMSPQVQCRVRGVW
jgi:hypothetical protein